MSVAMTHDITDNTTANITGDKITISAGPRFRAAMILAIIADALQIGVFPLFVHGALSTAEAVLDISVYGSADGAAWGAKSMAAFPQEFYCGEWPLLLDLTARPEVKFVRAHWEMARWGRGTETPRFQFGVTLKEVPAEILKEATAEARTA